MNKTSKDNTSNTNDNYIAKNNNNATLNSIKLNNEIDSDYQLINSHLMVDNIKNDMVDNHLMDEDKDIENVNTKNINNTINSLQI